MVHRIVLDTLLILGFKKVEKHCTTQSIFVLLLFLFHQRLYCGSLMSENSVLNPLLSIRLSILTYSWTCCFTSFTLKEGDVFKEYTPWLSHWSILNDLNHPRLPLGLLLNYGSSTPFGDSFFLDGFLERPTFSSSSLLSISGWYFLCYCPACAQSSSLKG